jgi:hypothetical protein
MPLGFTEPPRAPKTQPSSEGGELPPDEVVGAGKDDAPEVSPPTALMRRRRNTWFWLGIALLLGAVISLALVAMTTG